MLTPYNQAATYTSGLPPPFSVLHHFLDIAVGVSDVFMVILEEEELFELVTVPSNMICDLMAGEIMCLSVIVV